MFRRELIYILTELSTKWRDNKKDVLKKSLHKQTTIWITSAIKKNTRKKQQNQQKKISVKKSIT